MQTTQHYAIILDKKVSENMQILTDKLDTKNSNLSSNIKVV